MKPGSKWMIKHRRLGCPAFSVPCCAYFGDLLPSDMHLIEITPQLRFPWTTALHLFPSKDAFILIVSYVFQNMEVLHLMVFGCFWMFSACRKPRLGPGHKLMSTSLSSPSRFRKIQRCMAQDYTESSQPRGHQSHQRDSWSFDKWKWGCNDSWYRSGRSLISGKTIGYTETATTWGWIHTQTHQHSHRCRFGLAPWHLSWPKWTGAIFPTLPDNCQWDDSGKDGMGSMQLLGEKHASTEKWSIKDGILGVVLCCMVLYNCRHFPVMPLSLVNSVRYIV